MFVSPTIEKMVIFRVIVIGKVRSIMYLAKASTKSRWIGVRFTRYEAVQRSTLFSSSFFFAVWRTSECIYSNSKRVHARRFGREDQPDRVQVTQSFIWPHDDGLKTNSHHLFFQVPITLMTADLLVSRTGKKDNAGKSVSRSRWTSLAAKRC